LLKRDGCWECGNDDPRRAIADRLLAICEQPSDEQAIDIAEAGFSDDPEASCASIAHSIGRTLLALAKGTAPQSGVKS
jgi:hypothetical protein